MKALLAFMPSPGKSPINVGKASFYTEDGQMLTYDFQGGAVMPNGVELRFKRVPNGITIAVYKRTRKTK